MNFNEYITKSWTDHAEDSPKVFKTFSEGEKLISSNDDIPTFVNLVTHVCGVHLGDWKAGLDQLQKLTKLPVYQAGSNSEAAIKRSSATLRLSSGELKDLNGFSISDQARIYAMSTTMLADRNEMPRAQQYFSRSLELATSLSKDDPANRSLAVTGNNLASSLEEKKDRSETDVKLMLLAAQTGIKYWGIVGGPSEFSLAEYRMARSYLKAGLLEKSYQHAILAADICEKNQLTSSDCFYGYKILAIVENERKNKEGFKKAFEKLSHHFELLSPEDKKSCEVDFKELKAIR